MAMKSFSEFTNNNISEASYEGSTGKTTFSRWLRDMNTRVADDMKDSNYYSSYYDSDDKYQAARRATNLIPNAFRLITGAGAAVADFLTPKGSSKEEKNSNKFTKDELKAKKTEILNKWERDHIGDKKVTDSDAEKFYKSGVIKGKKYFGKDFDPANPKNKEEEMYTDYMNGIMERYYKKTTNA